MATDTSSISTASRWDARVGHMIFQSWETMAVKSWSTAAELPKLVKPWLDGL